MDNGMMTLAAAAFAMGAGAVVALWRRMSGFMADMERRVDKRVDESMAAEMAGVEERVERFHQRATAAESRLTQLERRGHEIELSVLKAVKEAADDGTKWREELRKEFAQKDAVAGSIALAMAEWQKEAAGAKEQATQRISRKDLQEKAQR